MIWSLYLAISGQAIPSAFGLFTLAQTVSMTADFQELLKNTDYVSRKQAIERNTENCIQSLKGDIQKLQYQKSIIESSRLRDIIKKANIDSVFSVNFTNEIGEKNTFAEIKASPYFPLIKYLVKEGYIDETYPDYMTYFYENSLSRIDKIFLRSVTDEKPKEYTYSLKKPQLVLSRLRDVDFDHEEILNFDLLCHLLITKQNNQSYLTRFLQQLKSTKNYKFIGSFLDAKRELQQFIENLNNLWPSIFNCILNESNFTDEQKKLYAISTLLYSSSDDIKLLNENKCLSNFISNSPAFLDIENPDCRKMVDGFSLLGVRFTSIDYNVSNKELFRAIYEKCLYQLSFELISLMLKVFYGLPQSKDFNDKNYTLILSKPDEPLVKYVKEDINSYIRIVLNSCKDSITDNKFTTLVILNNPDINNDSKVEYIGFLETKLDNLEEVKVKDLWSLLLKKKLVNYSEANILSYFLHSEKGLDEPLVEFINGQDNSLNFKTISINGNFGEEATTQFFDAVVICDKLSNEKYTNILKTLDFCYPSFTLADIPDDKIEILIDLKVVRMSDEVLTFMRENYPNQLLMFIERNISVYIDEVINKENFILDEMLYVLELNVDDTYKIKLIQLTKNTLSVKKGYSDAIKKHILNNNLDINDIEFLLSSYPHESINVRKTIEGVAIKHISTIIEERHPVSLELFSKLLSSSQLNRDNKIELFAISLPNMDEAQCKKCLSILQLPDYLSLFEGKRPKFEVNNINQSILTAFEKKFWISSFDLDKDDGKFYRAFGRKEHNLNIR